MMVYIDGYHGGLFLTPEDELLRHLGKLCDLLDQHPSYRATLEIEAYTWEALARRRDPILNKLLRQVRGGRIQLVGGSYAQPLYFYLSGEIVVRDLQIGNATLREAFGIAPTTYACQEPCFASQLPQILDLLGYENAVLRNTWCIFGYPPAKNSAKVLWTGPDGTGIPTSPRYEFQRILDHFGVDNYPSQKFFDQALEKGILTPATWNCADFNNRDFPWQGGRLISGLPEVVRHSTWKEYFQSIVGQAAPRWMLRTQDFILTYPHGLLGGRVERAVRNAVSLLTDAEKIATLSRALVGTEYPTRELNEAWKKLLLATHHDVWVCAPIIFGEWKRYSRSYAKLCESWTGEVASRSGSVVSNALRILAESIDTRDSGHAGKKLLALVVVNVQHQRKCPAKVRVDLDKGQARCVRVVNSEGSEVPCQVVETERYPDGSIATMELLFETDVPSFGYRTYYLIKGSSSIYSDLVLLRERSGGLLLENSYYQVRIDPARGGSLSIFDKDQDVDMVKGGNRFEGCFEAGVAGVGGAESLDEAQVLVLEHGPARLRVRVSGCMSDVSYRCDISLYSRLKRVDIDACFDFKEGIRIGYSSEDPRTAWRDNIRKLRTLFPLTLRRGDFFVDAPFSAHRCKHSSASPAVSWIDASDGESGVAILLDRSSGVVFDQEDSGCIAISLVLAYGGPYEYARGHQALLCGTCHYAYSVTSHKGNWADADLPILANDYSSPVYVFPTPIHSGRLPSKTSIMEAQGKAVLTAAYVEGEDLCWRFYAYEATDLNLRVGRDLGYRHADVVDLLGNIRDSPFIVDGESIRIGMRDSEIVTIRLAPSI